VLICGSFYLLIDNSYSLTHKSVKFGQKNFSNYATNFNTCVPTLATGGLWRNNCTSRSYIIGITNSDKDAVPNILLTSGYVYLLIRIPIHNFLQLQIQAIIVVACNILKRRRHNPRCSNRHLVPIKLARIWASALRLVPATSSPNN